MPDFWPSCGYRLLDGRAPTAGSRSPTISCARSLLRPELAPIPESCAAELALHEKLMAAPRAAVAADELAPIADADARENYGIWLRFRDRLAAAPSIEAAYVALFRDGVDVPPLFVHQLTADPAAPHHRRRGRSARGARRRDAVPAAEDRRRRRRLGDGRRRGDGRAARDDRRFRQPRRAAAAEPHAGCARPSSTCSTPPTRPTYWDRDERYDLAVSLNRGQPALAALCRVLEKWVAHFLGVAVAIRPQREIDDHRWVWHVGLDAEASALLNDLYNRVDVDEARMARLLCLFELTFADPGDMRPADRRPPRLSRDGDGRRCPAQAEAAEPAAQPAARAAAMKSRNDDEPIDSGRLLTRSRFWRVALRDRLRRPRKRPQPPPTRRRAPPRKPRRRPARAARVARGLLARRANRANSASTGCRCAATMMVGASHTVYEGQDAELRVSADRNASRRHLLRRPAVGKKETAFKFEGEDRERRRTATTTSSSSPIPLGVSAADRLSARHGGWLYATLEGKVNGAERKVIYPMRRVDCETGEVIKQ